MVFPDMGLAGDGDRRLWFTGDGLVGWNDEEDGGVV